MKNLIYSTLSVILLHISNNSCVQAKITNSDDKAIIMLKNFYTEYITFIAHPPSIILSDGADSIQKKYCTISLINRINKQFENEEIDIDPFLKGQDTDIRFLETLSIKKDSTKPNDFIVSYIYSYITPSDNKEVKYPVIIHLTVIKEKDHFKIDSVW